MKFYILLVALFSLLIVTIYAADEVPKQCEDYFKVYKCNECQKELWDSWADSWANNSSCAFFIRLIKNIMKNYGHNMEVDHTHHFTYFNVTPYNDAVKETCDEKFSCTYDEAESSWKNVENKCSDELSTKVDWSADPLSLDRTVSSAYATVLFYYFGIPDHDLMCSKSSSGELCGIKYPKPLLNWLKEKVPEGNFRISFDHKFVYRDDGSRLEIPRELLACGECAKDLSEIIEYWPEKHPLPDYIVKNIFGSWEDVKDFYTCRNDYHSNNNHTPRRLLRFNRNLKF